MAKNPKERNGVNVFSDYGLDERQKQYASQLGFKSFKALYYGALVLTMIWFALWVFEVSIPYQYPMLSYFLLIEVCENFYKVQAARHGIINGISAFSMYTKWQIIIRLTVAVSLTATIIHKWETEYTIIVGTIAVLTVIDSIIEYLCGKKNFEVLDAPTEDDEDSEESDE